MSDELLADKDRARLNKVRSMLANDLNPYHKSNTITSLKGYHQRKVIDDTILQSSRLEKFNNTQGSHKWRFIDGDIETPEVKGVSCISCGKQIDATTSIYGKVVVSMIRKVVDGIIDTIKTRTVLMYPKFREGYSCRPCFDGLYDQVYYDKDNNLHHGIEMLNVSHVTHDTVSRQSKDDNLPRGREKVRRVTRVYLNKDHEIDDEEWVISDPLSSSRSSKPSEPVDPKAYNHFMKGRR